MRLRGMQPNQSLQPTANPLRGVSAAELGRYVSDGRSDAHGQPGRGAYIMALIVAIAVFLSVSAYAQSDETCIAYMEADAIYKAALSAAYDAGGEAASAAYTAVMLPHKVTNRTAYEAANKAGFEAAEKTGARCGGLFVPGTDQETALRLACEAQRAGYTATLESLGVDEKAVEDRANRAARAAEGNVERAAMKAAREERARAYAAAYKGPTSTVDTVMAKLIKADRKRCRRRLE